MSKPFKIKKQKDGKFYFVYQPANNNEVMVSKGYKQKAHAKRAIKSLVKGVFDVYILSKSKDVAYSNVDPLSVIIEDQTV